jgi:hypothetical protein
MTTIIEALQDKDNRLRLTNFERWLVGDGEGRWTVYERKAYAKKTTVVYEGFIESSAVAALLEEDVE